MQTYARGFAIRDRSDERIVECDGIPLWFVSKARALTFIRNYLHVAGYNRYHLIPVELAGPDSLELGEVDYGG